ncbi:ATP-dependent DNA helicase RecG [Thermocrinis minervae]|uniref:ATP-dependent DNA helicase RecG n=1 Tax=Thermocrinis minervae TaxID=381751 RepID=A0A1M6TCM7_9AQUI|nr:ATP-dependent DNA helicase RecG [Thermocrinis minervae]SHK54757.1 ATP-dependent DNA helicase RecG [Thermocrinis minervae]
MTKVEKAKKLLQELTDKNFLLLKRSKNVGIYLFSLLKDILPQDYLELLKGFDGYSLEKKKALLMTIRSFIEAADFSPRTFSFEHEKKLPLEKFFKKVEDLKVLDQKEKKVLLAFGIQDMQSALWYVPVRYEDRRLNTSIGTAIVGQKVALKVRVVDKGYQQDEKYPAFVKVADSTGVLYLRYKYKNPRFLARFVVGKEMIVYGKLLEYKGEKYMVHPEVLSQEEAGLILPFYYIRTKSGLKLPAKQKHKKLRAIMEKLVEYVKHMPEYMPQEWLKSNNYPSIAECLYFVHKPSHELYPLLTIEDLNAFLTPYQRRLSHEELLLYQLALRLRRLEAVSHNAVKPSEDFLKHIENFKKSLPFKLTQAQERVIEEIVKDILSGKPMQRLLQGDVGSGKTVVSMAIAYAFAMEGYQSAIMVPTEILARQHFENFQKLLAPLGVNVALLTSSVKGAERQSVYKHTKEGNIHVLVGTHALLEEDVEFKKLAFVVIDEQHRFGVLQRKLLLEKGKGYYPHSLVMSATPIPRTLALSLYGDLDISVIDQMPEGRKPIITMLFFESQFDRVVEKVRQEVQKGHKVYVVYPVIEESEKLQLKALMTEHEKWKKLFPDKEVHILHGKMKEEDKRKVMEAFKERGHILLSTTVIEVGIDVPDATVMVIESAHRFGLSQLHQLRGRVGRSHLQSYCYLVVPDEVKQDEDAINRLKVMVRTNDGFKIAEEDLKLRGPGDLLGAAQSGYFGFWVANLTRLDDLILLEKAKKEAEEILSKDPKLESYPDLKKVLLYRYGDRMDLSHIA